MTIRITFPAGTKANLRTNVPVDELLKALQAPDADVEGQSAGGDEITCVPGAPD